MRDSPGLERIEAILGEVGLPWHAVGVAAGELALAGDRAYAVACLPYPLERPPAPEGVPSGAIAAFARVHWYRELSARLMAARALLMEDLRQAGGAPRKADFRVMVNSRVGEKPLALAAGLGSRGRTSLVIHPLLGPAVILGALSLPFLPEGLEATGAEPSSARGDPPPLSPSCRGCRACAAACPSQAVRGDGSIEVERCLQHWATEEGPLPDWILPLWGDRLYGCDACLDACMRRFPRGRDADLPAIGEDRARGLPGSLGAWIPLIEFLSADDGGLERILAGSAAGMKWVSRECLRRNALVAAGSATGVSAEARARLQEILAGYKKSDRPALSQAAEWSLTKLKTRPA